MPADRPSPVLRAPEPGELGWIAERHATLYAREFGWNGRIEITTCRIVADLAESTDPGERLWIAEHEGRPAGCIACVRVDDTTAKLRLLLVDPAARGLGLGTTLTRTVIAFAREQGYARLTLWTDTVLAGARRIYEQEGFELRSEQEHTEFGPSLVGQEWSLEL